MKEFETSQYLPRAELEQLQFGRLSNLLQHAFAECPFYRSRFHAAGLKPGSIKSLSDLRQLPVLTKEDIQRHRDAMIAKNWPRNDLIPNQTGGSTGTPISFFLGSERACSRAAATWRHNRWAGYDIGERLACLWGAVRDAPVRSRLGKWKDNILTPTMLLNTANVTQEGLASFMNKMHRFRPKSLLAYSKSAVLLARFVLQSGLKPYQLASIITSAEVLEPFERQLLEETFGCPVFNRYGCREVSVIASECECHNGLHIMAEGLYVEIERNGGPVPAGEPGSILVTDLLNFAMPLIRYRIGDVGALMQGVCQCGRNLPRLEGIQGRVTDFLVGGDGRLVSGAALTVAVIAKRPTLGQVQLIQDRPGQVLFKIAPKNGVDPSPEDLHFLQEETKKYLGERLESEVEFVTEIPCEPSGKFIFSKSRVKNLWQLP